MSAVTSESTFKWYGMNAFSTIRTTASSAII